MGSANAIGLGLAIGFLAMAASPAQAAVARYTLDNVVLDDQSAQMTGTFAWTYDVGDFQNGVGQFTALEVPFTLHDHTDLDAVFDVVNSIEITLPGSVHDDGVDITLFLAAPLTPTSGAAIDLDRSAYEIGGNGFHTGAFVSGSIVPTTSAPAIPLAGILALAAMLVALGWHRMAAMRRRANASRTG